MKTESQTKKDEVKEIPQHKDDFIKDLNEPVEQTVHAEEEKPNNEVSLFNQNATPQNNSNLTKVDMTGELPDLDDEENVQVSPLDLAGNYWTPTEPNESKKVYFDCIEVAQYRDVNDADVVVELTTAYFYTKSKADGVKRWSNASKKLISIIERNHIERGTPLQITYLGKKKNATNNFKSDDWSVKPLILKIA